MTFKTVSLAVACVVSAASAIAEITVGPNVQISKATTSTRCTNRTQAPTLPIRNGSLCMLSCSCRHGLRRHRRFTCRRMAGIPGEWHGSRTTSSGPATLVCTFAPDGSAY
jgi:hypothetical protein